MSLLIQMALTIRTLSLCGEGPHMPALVCLALRHDALTNWVCTHCPAQNLQREVD